MEIDYTVTLNYEDLDRSEPDESEPSPAAADVQKWVIAGMAKDGFSCDVKVMVERQ